MFTGAIADYGPSYSALATGKTSKKPSTYELLKFKKGTILLNTKALATAITKATPTVTSSNCSISISTTASAPFVKGTGAYTGITGTVKFTLTFAGISPKTKSGSCTLKTSTTPLSTYEAITGTGSISYP